MERFTAERVEVVGEVDDPTAFFQSLTVAAYPGDLGTGTKNTLLEALASGTAVVASATAARGVDRAAQLLVADDHPAFADAIVTVLTDVLYRRRLQQRAREWASALPSWQTVAEQYAAVLRSVIPPERRPPP